MKYGGQRKTHGFVIIKKESITRARHVMKEGGVRKIQGLIIFKKGKYSVCQTSYEGRKIKANFTLLVYVED